jgi:hypothetical protein
VKFWSFRQGIGFVLWVGFVRPGVLVRRGFPIDLTQLPSPPPTITTHQNLVSRRRIVGIRSIDYFVIQYDIIHHAFNTGLLVSLSFQGELCTVIICQTSFEFNNHGILHNVRIEIDSAFGAAANAPACYSPQGVKWGPVPGWASSEPPRLIAPKVVHPW